MFQVIQLTHFMLLNFCTHKSAVYTHREQILRENSDFVDNLSKVLIVFQLTYLLVIQLLLVTNTL